MKKYILTTLFLPLAVLVLAQTIAIRNANIHTGKGKVITNGAVGIKDGKIAFVGPANSLNISEYDAIINAAGKELYPGFIALNVPMGLVEIEAVRSTRDFNETGSINPNVRSLIAYNAESEIIPTVAFNGVLYAQSTPRGGTISGTSSVFHLDGWNWDDAVHTIDDGVHMSWPSAYRKTGWWANPGPTEKNKKYTEQKQGIEDFFNKAQAYSKKSNSITDVKLAAMEGVFSGKTTLFIHANTVQQIKDVIAFKKQFGLSNVVLKGGYEAYLVPELLLENRIPVVLSRLHSLPKHQEDAVDLNFRLPALLEEAGLLYTFDMSGDMEPAATRNLPFTAGTAAAYGLTKEEAVKAVTYNAAKILGLENKIGSIEVGKEATLFLSEGDALDMRSNQVTMAMIRGKEIKLGGKQQDLNARYLQKHGLKN